MLLGIEAYEATRANEKTIIVGTMWNGMNMVETDTGEEADTDWTEKITQSVIPKRTVWYVVLYATG